MRLRVAIACAGLLAMAALPARAAEPTLCDALTRVVVDAPAGFKAVKDVTLPGASDCAAGDGVYTCHLPVPAGDLMVLMDMRLVDAVSTCFPAADHRLELYEGGKIDHFAVPGGDLGMGDLSDDHMTLTLMVKKSP